MTVVLDTVYQGKRTLDELCDYGVAEHRRDPTILIRFEVMGFELEGIARYMRKRYPDVPYTFIASCADPSIQERIDAIRDGLHDADL